MNPVAEEMLLHYGMPRRSGRYPWGSGEDPYQHGRDFLGRVDELRKQKFTYTDPETGKTYAGDTAIAKSMGLTTSQFRTEIGLATDERRMLSVARAKSLKADGKSNSEIGREMGVRESTVRSWLNAESEARMNKAQETADFLKARSKECEADGGMIDVGAGAERELRISKEKMNQALYLLEREGWHVYSGGFDQPTNPGQRTTQKVLCPPGTKHSEIYDLDRVHTVKEYISRDGGDTYEKKFHYPASLDSSRVKVLLADEIGPDGLPGIAKDGLIEIRRGVPDLSLGESRYSQVRILVDGKKYLKGMAVYSDNMPDGVDVLFSSNKKRVEDAYKDIKDDPDNPFGSAIKDADQGGQYWYDPKTGARVSSKTPGAKLGLINKRADEGDWSDWKDALPSQFLSKQNINLAKKQLGLAQADKQAEFDEICALQNPTVKKHLLAKFADSCDSAAVHLQAAALPGQKYHVMIPINTLKDDEIFAPQYKDGTKLALIRYPHGGTFEIPILKVNNKNQLARQVIEKSAPDAVGVCKKVADRLSGADYDGDTVMCIPTGNGKVDITSTPLLKGLIGFEPKDKYGPESYAGREVRLMTKKGTQMQMGIITNLITDMSLTNYDEEDLAAAVRHSMVIIDAHKHKLDYKQSEIDNNIAALHKKYQGKASGGASTIISRASSEDSVDKRKGSPKINKKGTPDYDPSKPEGALLWKTDPDAYYTVTKTNKRTGEVTTETRVIKQKTTKMAKTDDAYTLLSEARHPMEIVYADHANFMKSLANQARKELAYTGKIEYDANAKRIYKTEVDSLMTKLNVALLNAPRERAATRMANAEIQAKKQQGLLTDKGDEKKAAQKAVSKYRAQVGAVKRSDRNIEITDREWEAIQAGAISEHKLKQILDNADVDSLRQRATPRATTTLSQGKISKIKAMNASSYTIEEIASSIGVSPSTVSKYLKGAN